MKLKLLLYFLFGLMCSVTNGQSSPTVEEVYMHLNNQIVLFAYFETDEEQSTTYYDIEIHFCASGEYRLSAVTTVTDDLDSVEITESKLNGKWEVVMENGVPGISYYTYETKEQAFNQIFKSHDGDFFIQDGITLEILGPALCDQ